MTIAEKLSELMESVMANEDFTEAVMQLSDKTRLCFWHRVGERGAKSVGPEGNAEQGGLADAMLNQITTFRLNSKHLDIEFTDGSRWDQPVPLAET